MKRISVSLALLLSATLTLPAYAAGDAEAGKAKAVLCAACHGADGNGNSTKDNPASLLWPKLAAQHPGYIAKQLRDYKSGGRVDPTMTGMAATLQDADIDNVAAFFASQPRKVGSVKPEMVELGQKLFRGGDPAKGLGSCMACHGPGGTGNPLSNYPAIAGQNAAYTTKALKDFRSGARANDANKMMRTVAGKMSDAEIEAVSAYIEGLYQ